MLAAVLRRTEQSAIYTLSAQLHVLFPEIVTNAAQLPSTLALAGEGDSIALVRAIFGRNLQKLARGSQNDTLAFLRRRVHRDFEYGQLIMVDGWHLSQTEARLLAFFAKQ